VNWGYDQDQQPHYYDPPSRGRPVLAAFITSVITTVAVFFGLREIEARGYLKGRAAQAPGAVEVPSVVGLKAEQARDLLRTRHLLLTIGGERDDASHPAGTILSQTPLAGSMATPGSAVQTVLAKSVPVVVVPNVAGLKVEDATRHLQSLGLKLAAPASAPSDTVAAGLVVGTNPAVGTSTSPQTAVALVVSSGAAGKAVPKVVGMKLPRGKKILEDAGFKVGKTTYKYDRHYGEYVILKQTPAEGQKAAAGTEIELVVNEPG
jgi:serine/threonine-protein kinase